MLKVNANKDCMAFRSLQEQGAQELLAVRLAVIEQTVLAFNADTSEGDKLLKNPGNWLGCWHCV